MDLFEEAKKFVGILKNDECYCFVPVLPLGGKKSVKTLEIGKTREHIEVITQLVGGVGMGRLYLARIDKIWQELQGLGN